MKCNVETEIKWISCICTLHPWGWLDTNMNSIHCTSPSSFFPMGRSIRECKHPYMQFGLAETPSNVWRWISRVFNYVKALRHTVYVQTWKWEGLRLISCQTCHFPQCIRKEPTPEGSSNVHYYIRQALFVLSKYLNVFTRFVKKNTNLSINNNP